MIFNSLRQDNFSGFQGGNQRDYIRGKLGLMPASFDIIDQELYRFFKTQKTTSPQISTRSQKSQPREGAADANSENFVNSV